jgi:hypothetical protein
MNDKTELTVFEDISKQIVVKENLKVPMSMVFARGTVGNLPSFGGKSLAENTQQVDLAIANTAELHSIWNHSHTQWMWKHLNLSWHAPLKNMRQIAADINSRKAALNEAKWRHVEAELKIKKIEDELQNSETLEYWREVELKVKLVKFKEGLVEGMTYIEGAMKDILALNDIYEQLKAKVSNFSEADIEKEESKSHLKRSLVQCIRDVRQSGSISKGEQEYMEQIGVNPMKIQKLIRVYVKSEEESDSWDVSGLYSFVDSITNELIDVYNVDAIRMDLQGFDTDIKSEYTQTEKIALFKDFSKDSE